MERKNALVTLLLVLGTACLVALAGGFAWFGMPIMKGRQIGAYQLAKQGDKNTIRKCTAFDSEFINRHVPSKAVRELGVTDSKQTPLEVAVVNGDLEAAIILLDLGADADRLGGGNLTALHSACYYGRLPFVELLVARRCDVNRIGGLSETPLDTLLRNECKLSPDIIRAIESFLKKHGAKTFLELKAAPKEQQ